MNLQKRTLKKLKRLFIEERWFNNAEFDSLFVHTYLNTKALVLGHKSSIFILMDKRCDVLRLSSSSIKETEEEILKAGLMLREKLKVDTTPSPWKEYRPVLVEERPRDRCATEHSVTLPPSERERGIGEIDINEIGYAQVEYRTFTGAIRGSWASINTTQGENE